MRRYTALVLVTACGGAGGDVTIDITHDACMPLSVVAKAPTSVQLEGIAQAIELWRGRGAPLLGEGNETAIEVRFERAALSFHGLYDDEAGVIYVNEAITDPSPLRIVIAHELGHAFGLQHITQRTSLMNPGNLELPPTPEDQAALQALWGACAPH